MDFKKYQNEVEYPENPQKPVEPRYSGDSVKYLKESNAFVKAIKEYNKDLAEHKNQLKKRRVEENRLTNLFQHDALEEVGLSNHPKASKIFGYAWDQGHACGYEEVFIYLQDIAELFKD